MPEDLNLLSDKEIVEKLEKDELEQKLVAEQKEIFGLMTNNKEQSRYKSALVSTIHEIKYGKRSKEDLNGSER